MNALASVTAIDEARQRGVPYATATEWTISAAVHQHQLLDRTRTIMRARRRPGTVSWIYGWLAAYRQHTRTNPACPLCKQLLRRERLRDHRLYGPPPGRPS